MADAQPDEQPGLMPTWAPSAAPPEIPKASMSRFQLLIFTFVIAGLYLALCLENGRLIDIPENVLLLLGLSSGTYAASKGIKAVSDRKSEAAPVTPVVDPTSGTKNGA